MTKIAISLAAVLLLIVAIGYFAMRFLRADDTDEFDDRPAEPSRPRGRPGDQDWGPDSRTTVTTGRPGRGARGQADAAAPHRDQGQAARRHTARAASEPRSGAARSGGGLDRAGFDTGGLDTGAFQNADRSAGSRSAGAGPDSSRPAGVSSRTLHQPRRPGRRPGLRPRVRRPPLQLQPPGCRRPGRRGLPRRRAVGRARLGRERRGEHPGDGRGRTPGPGSPRSGPRERPVVGHQPERTHPAQRRDVRQGLGLAVRR